MITPRTSTKLVKQKYSYRYSGIGTDVRFGAHGNTLVNIQRAISERVLFVPSPTGGLQACPRPLSRGYYFNVMKPFYNLIEKKVRNDSSFPIQPLSDEQFCSMYSGSKKARYQEACSSLLRESVVQKDSHIRAFVKVEKINFSSKPDPAPRIIQPRTFRYQASLGKNIKHVEKPLFKIIDDIYGGPTVLKGYDCVESGRHLKNMWDTFVKPVGIGLDASRFDQHCSVPALEWEHLVWLLLCKNKTQLKKLLSWQLKNQGASYTLEGFIKYVTNGCRMSGDMNTSSGNCLLMCAMVYCYMLSIGVSKFRLANNGDDCMLIVEEGNEKVTRAGINSFFISLGYTMKVEPTVKEFERISFCQTSPVFDGVGYRMVRDPRVSIGKDLCSTLDLGNDKIKSMWLDAMNQGGKALTVGIPVLNKFYNIYPLNNKHKVTKKDSTLLSHQESGFSRMAGSLKFEERIITDESRYSFWLAFGILPDTQVALENNFSQICLNRCSIDNDRQEYTELSLLVEN